MLLPHSGVFPYNRTLDSVMMDNIHNDVIRAGDAVIATLLGIDGPLDSNSEVLKSSFPMSHLTSVILKIFAVGHQL